MSLPGLAMLWDQGCPCPKVKRDRGVPILKSQLQASSGVSAVILSKGGPLLSPVLLCLGGLRVDAGG